MSKKSTGLNSTAGLCFQGGGKLLSNTARRLKCIYSSVNDG